MSPNAASCGRSNCDGIMTGRVLNPDVVCTPDYAALGVRGASHRANPH
jgi:hypothetical protein